MLWQVYQTGEWFGERADTYDMFAFGCRYIRHVRFLMSIYKTCVQTVVVAGERGIVMSEPRQASVVANAGANRFSDFWGRSMFGWVLDDFWMPSRASSHRKHRLCSGCRESQLN